MVYVGFAVGFLHVGGDNEIDIFVAARQFQFNLHRVQRSTRSETTPDFANFWLQSEFQLVVQRNRFAKEDQVETIGRIPCSVTFDFAAAVVST